MGIGDIDGLAPPEVARPFVDHINRADFDAIVAGRAKGFIHVAGLLPDGNLEVPDITGNAGNLCIGNQFDVPVPARIGHFGSQNTDGAVHGGKGFIDQRHNAADGGAFFHQNRLITVVGKIQRRLNSRHPAADYQGTLGHRDFQFGNRLQEFGPGNRHPDQLKGLLSAFCFGVQMHPAALLANVGDFHHRRVQLAAPEQLLPGGAVEPR